MASCRQGFRWWEVDITYTILKILSFLGIARDLRPFRVSRQRVRGAA
jgi:stearoyl-CoA desaturase (delta-9 desaturase)